MYYLLSPQEAPKSFPEASRKLQKFQGRNPCNFLLLFWSKWWQQKDISKLTDLYNAQFSNQWCIGFWVTYTNSYISISVMQKTLLAWAKKRFVEFAKMVVIIFLIFCNHFCMKIVIKVSKTTSLVFQANLKE